MIRGPSHEGRRPTFPDASLSGKGGALDFEFQGRGVATSTLRFMEKIAVGEPEGYLPSSSFSFTCPFREG